MRAALVGYGLAGRVFHAPLVRSAPALTLAAVVSSRPADVHADLGSVAVIESVDELLGTDAADVVIVATPNTTHYGIARAALEAGKHVVVDKPLATTAQEADALIDLARANELVLSVFQNRRWDADFLTLRECLSEGRLGTVYTYESRYDRYRPDVRDRWREHDLPGSGVWFDLGAHLVDQALELFGNPGGLFADLQRQRPGSRVCDYFHVVLDYGALRAVLHAGSLVPEPSLRFAVHGEAGSFVKHGLDPQEEQLRAGMRPGQVGFGLEPASQAAEVTRPGVAGHPAGGRVPSRAGSYSVFYEELTRAILGRAQPPVAALDGRNVVAVLEAGEESARTGRVVELASRLREP